MEKEVKIAVNNDGKFEVSINRLSGGELMVAIGQLIVSIKKLSLKCGIKKDDKLFNKHIQMVVDRAISGNPFTSEEEVATEMLDNVLKALINDLKQKSKCETEDESEEEKTNDEKSILFTLPAGNSIVEYNNGASTLDLTSVLFCALCELREHCIDGHLDALCESVIRLVRNVILDETDEGVKSL